VKVSKTYSLRTAQAFARYGKAARYPVCQAGLQLWQLDAELLKLAKDSCSLSEVLSSAKKLKKQAQALLDQFYKERREKDVIDAAALVQKINEHLKKTERAYQATVKGFTLWLERPRPLAAAQFAREYDAIVRAKDTKAKRALERVHKKWSANPNADGVRLKDGARRELEILKMLHDQAIKAAFFKDGAIGGYTEAAFGGDRLLSDEFWQGRLTARGIHSRLMALGGSRLAGDKDAKEIRRLLTRLGVRPAEDQRGRKWKPTLPKKQEPRKPLGRPSTSAEPDMVLTDGIEFFEDTSHAWPDGTSPRGKRQAIKTPQRSSEDGEGEYKEVKQLVRELYDIEKAERNGKAIENEIARLRKKRGAPPLPKYLDKPRKPEGQTKGRSPGFAAFLDSD
jgi:hypothetical protein